jgi:very-short-patch-repair endonuclease
MGKKTRINGWQCIICQKVFKTRIELYQHKKEVNHRLIANKQWKCNCCDEIFDTSTQLRKHKKELNHKLILNKQWKCNHCDNVFESRRKMLKHRKESHNISHFPGNIKCEVYCKFCGRLSTTITGLKIHEKSCRKNPNRIPGSSHPQLAGAKISKGLKKAYQEGRAKGWMSSHSSHESYPEKWLKKVIQNEFDDKNYSYDLQVGHYAIDFAWKEKKLYIEMDGQQHERDLKQKESDIRKDEFLKERGWKVLRIPWKQCFKNPKDWIKIANNFIGKL